MFDTSYALFKFKVDSYNWSQINYCLWEYTFNLPFAFAVKKVYLYPFSNQNNYCRVSEFKAITTTLGNYEFYKLPEREDFITSCPVSI